MNISKKTKALVLLSGGLDSMLAIKVLQEQGIDVTALTFESNFFNAEKARAAAESLGVALKIIDIREELLSLVKNPPSGLGKNANPCIDCHALMIKKAGELAKQENFDFLATGEVMGQRPFSQNKIALGRVMKLAGLEVLRPLSAKLLEETEVEKHGLVDREKLLDIEGRTRERQMELAKQYGITDYPSPAGGCLLTDPGFGDRLKELIANWPDAETADAEIIKYGRIFWVSKNILVIIGRHASDNANLLKYKQAGDILIELADMNGPLTLVRTHGKNLEVKNNKISLDIPEDLPENNKLFDEKNSDEDILKNIATLAGYYAVKARGQKVNLKICKI